MEQSDTITQEQAIALAKSEFWKEMTHEEIAKFQMINKRLCMPFEVFHEALEKALGRSVWTHELGVNFDGLADELFDGAPAPSFEEIVEMIPENKRMLVVVK